MRLLSLLLMGGTMACSSVTTEEPMACDGRLSTHATVLQSEVDHTGVLRVTGDQLLFVTESSVQRVDPCSGALEPLVELEHIRATAYYDRYLYIRHTDIMGVYGWLSRAPINGGEVERVADLGSTGAIVGSPQGIYSLVRDPVSESDRLLAEVSTGTPNPLVSIDTANLVKVFSLVGAGDRGVYLRGDWDAGYALGLLRWPHEGNELVDVDGTPGVRLVDVLGDELAVVREIDYHGQEIALVPAVGGQGRVVVPNDELPPSYGVTALTATNDALCWIVYGGGPNCKRLDSTETRAIDRGEASSLALLGDVLYWVRARELLAAVP